MVRMIADRDFPYRGQSLKAGDPFDADDEHVHVFTVIGHAHVDGGTQTYETRVMTARSPRRRGMNVS